MNDSFFYQKKVSHAVLAAALSLSALTGNAAVIAEESGETPDGEIAEETLPEESAEESEEPEESGPVFRHDLPGSDDGVLDVSAR